MRQSFGLHHTFLEMCEKYSTEKRIIKRSCSLIKQILQIRYQPLFCLHSVLSRRSFWSYWAQKSWEVWSVFNPVTWCNHHMIDYDHMECDPCSNRKIMFFTLFFFFSQNALVVLPEIKINAVLEIEVQNSHATSWDGDLYHTMSCAY